MKGKPLLPVLKTKKRYVVFEIVSDSLVEVKKAFYVIKDQYKKLFGIYGLGISGLMNTRIYDKNKKKSILKVNNKYLNELKTTLAFIKKIDDKDVILKTNYVSGILKKAKLHLQ
jgi:RNase P/RNase MRP subunit POP5